MRQPLREANSCPICGKRHILFGGCSRRTLEQIDRAHRAEPLEPTRVPREPGYGERLAAGFRLLAD